MVSNMQYDIEAELVYRTVLKHREYDRNKLSKLTGLPGELVTDLVGRLTSLQLLQPSGEHPGQVQAVAPEIGLSALLQHQYEQVSQFMMQSGLQLKLFSLMAESAARSSDGSAACVLRTSEEILEQLELLSRACQHEVLSMQAAPRLSPEAIAAERMLSEQALSRGVRFRSIYLGCALKDKTTLAYLRSTQEHFAEIRTMPWLPLSVTIIDSSVAVIADDKYQPEAAVVRSDGHMMQALCALSELCWNAADPLDRPPYISDDRLSADEEYVLKMLAAGTKDAAIARSLGVSVRTVRRIIADLMIQMRAGSRFEAGVKAVRSGLV